MKLPTSIASVIGSVTKIADRGPPPASALQLPSAGETVSIHADASKTDLVASLIGRPGTRASISERGTIVLTLAEGGRVELLGTERAVAALADRHDELLSILTSRDSLQALLSFDPDRSLARESSNEPTSDTGPMPGGLGDGPELGPDRGAFQIPGNLRLAGNQLRLPGLRGLDSGRGRDDLLRNEVGQAGIQLSTPIGDGLPHLVGQDNKRIKGDYFGGRLPASAHVEGHVGDIGASPGHLGGLQNELYVNNRDWVDDRDDPDTTAFGGDSRLQGSRPQPIVPTLTAADDELRVIAQKFTGAGFGSQDEDHGALINDRSNIGLHPLVSGVRKSGDPSAFSPASVDRDVHGTYGDLHVKSDGSYTYTITDTASAHALQAGEKIKDFFDYTITAGGLRSQARIIITIEGFNDVPIAADDLDTVVVAPLTGAGSVREPSATGVLLNDTDPDTTDTLSVTGVKVAGDASAFNSSSVATDLQGTFGKLHLNADGSYTYTVTDTATTKALQAGQVLHDRFAYQITDGHGSFDSAFLDITIRGVNDTPVVVGPLHPGTAPADPDHVIPSQVGVDGSAIAPLSVASYFADPDTGETPTLSVDASKLPPGIIFSAATGTFSGTPGSAASQGGIDPAHPGVYSVPVTATDVHGASVTSYVTFTITNVAPVALNEARTTSEDGPPVSGSVLTNDHDGGGDTDTLSVASATDSGGHALTIGSAMTLPGGGTITLAADGSYTFDPGSAYQWLKAGEHAVETVDYVVSDGQGGTALARLTITINGASDAPVFSGTDTGTAQEDVTLTVTGTTGVSDADAGESRFVAASGKAGSYGSLSIDASGHWTYTLDNTLSAVQTLAVGSHLTDTIQVSSADGTTHSIVIRIDGTNDVPTAADNSNALTVAAATGAGSAANNDASGNPLVHNVLQNDGDIDVGDHITVSGSRPDGSIGAYTAAGTDVQGTYGKLHLNGDGTYTYTVTDTGTTKALKAGSQLTDAFQYQISDGNGGTTSAKLTITINGVNDTPSAQDNSQSITVTKGTGAGSVANDDANVDALKHNVLQNDSDPDTGTTLTVSGARPNGSSGAYTAAGTDVQGTYGKLHLNSDGTYSYTVTDLTTTKRLAVGEQLSDVFQYQIADGDGGTATAKVTIVINGVNDDPAAANDSNSLTVTAGTGAGSVTAGAASHVMLNDTDPDNGTTLVVAGARADGDPGAYAAPSSDVQGVYGNLHLNADGTYTYTVTDTATTKALATGEHLTDVFEYKVSDGSGGTATAKITITINGANDTPAAQDNVQAFTVAKGTGAGSVSNDDANANPLKHNVLQNDSDPDTSDALTVNGIRVSGSGGFTSVGAGGANISDTYGTLHSNKDGSYTYTLNATGQAAALALPEGQSLADRVFDYRISDGHSGTATAKLTISVTGVNDDPAGADRSLTATEDTALFITAANFGFSDPDTGNTLQAVQITNLPTHGQLLLGGVPVNVGDVIQASDLAASKLTFMPAYNESGTSYDQFKFAVYDGLSYDPTPNTMRINVTAVADKPDVTAPPAPIAAVEDTAVAITGSELLTAGLTDTDGSESLTLKITGVPSGATFNRGHDNGDGSWSFTAADYNAGLTFTPPPQASGTFPMTWEATSTESSNGSKAVNSALFSVYVAPVVDPVNLTSSSSSVIEDQVLALGHNILGQNVSGAHLTDVLADLDGSQSFSMTISGIPTGATIATPVVFADVTVDTSVGGSISISGSNASHVLQVIDALTLKPPANSDANFTLSISATTGENGSGLTTSSATVSHAVKVLADADAPTIDVPSSATIAENASSPLQVPVSVKLNDKDGSESLQSVTVTATVPADAAPTLDFPDAAAQGVTLTPTTHGFILTGTTAAIQATLATMTVMPGLHNGNDIRIDVTAVSIESSPSEGGAGEISHLTAPASNHFTVSVTPYADPIGLTVPASFNGTEDQTISFAGFSLSSNDTDGSEKHYVELSGLPTGTSFSGAGNVETSPGVWLIPEANLSGLTMTPPHDVSGSFTITARGISRDYKNGVMLSEYTTATQTVVLPITPVADTPLASQDSSGLEDHAVTFGATLADSTSGIRVEDTDTGSPEYLHQVTITVPNDPALPVTIHDASGNPIAGSGSQAGVGSAIISYDAGTRTYTITSTLSTVSASDRAQAESDIRATLTMFQADVGPTDTDDNPVLTVTATSIDTNGDAATQSFAHKLVIYAIADTPLVTAGASVTGHENTDIALSTVDHPITAHRTDTDGSEVLSVRISGVPAGSSIIGDTSGGGSIAAIGGNVFEITAPTEAKLNDILASLKLRPADFSGALTLNVQAISTETGPEISVKTAAANATVSIAIEPDVDAPIVKGNAVGTEDHEIQVPISVTLGDKDGSESYMIQLSGQPAGTVFTDGHAVTGYNADGSAIVDPAHVIGHLVAPGVYEFTPAEIAKLHILPPTNYSTAQSGPMTIDVSTIVTDTAGSVTASQTFTTTIDVKVTGVADAPHPANVTIDMNEDTPLLLGQAIVDSLGGSLSTALVDKDSSEKLYFVVSGLPTGVIPSVGTYIGNNSWQIDAADVSSLTIPTPANFSGDYIADFAPGMTVRAVSQEIDGSQTYTQVPVSIRIEPVTDGFSGWSPGAEVQEDHDIPLSGVAGGFSLIDSDGSERVLHYTVDLTNIVTKAGIGGVVADTADFIAHYIKTTGGASFEVVGGTSIKFTGADAAHIYFDAAAFKDSNVDFSLPVTALVEDTVGGPTKLETGSFHVDLVGVADKPTVFVHDASGYSGVPVVLDLGGESTDTDLTLARPASESIYYILKVVDNPSNVKFALGDATGQIVGLNNGDGTWYLEPSEIAGLRLLSTGGQAGTISFKLTTVAVENDGDLATNSDFGNFSVTLAVEPGHDGSSYTPKVPTVDIGVTTGSEDNQIVLNATAKAGAGDTSNPTLTLLISDLPPGASISGAILNVETGRWIAKAADIANGKVVVLPPADYSGDMTISVEAVATNSSLVEVTSGKQPMTVSVKPVADGVSISASPGPAFEDVPLDLNLSVQPKDQDHSSPENLVTSLRVSLDNGASLVGHTLDVDGTYHLTPADLAGLQMVSAKDKHGPVHITVEATSIEPTAHSGDPQATHTDTSHFTVNVTAVADAPTVTPSADITVAEDQTIHFSGLGAVLADNDGSEVLSAKIFGVPDGSIFSAGSNNGDGSWTIPAAALNTLSMIPPANYSGTMTLSIQAFSLELSNGDTAASTPQSFTVTVTPVADDVRMVARDVSTSGDGSVALDLNVRLTDDTAPTPGENPAETVQITFSGLPTDALLLGGTPGLVTSLGNGSWVFRGSEAQANALTIVP